MFLAVGGRYLPLIQLLELEGTRNQGLAWWDANGDGAGEDDIQAGQAVISDDPSTDTPGDPARWVRVPPEPVPALTAPAVLVLLLALLVLAVVRQPGLVPIRPAPRGRRPGLPGRAGRGG